MPDAEGNPITLDLHDVTEAMCEALADAAWPMPFADGDPAQRAELIRQVCVMVVPAIPAMIEAVGKMLQQDGWMPPVGGGYNESPKMVPWVI